MTVRMGIAYLAIGICLHTIYTHAYVYALTAKSLSVQVQLTPYRQLGKVLVCREGQCGKSHKGETRNRPEQEQVRNSV